MAVEVEVRFVTAGVVSAVVRDSPGIVDVRWTRGTGWSCSHCGDRACQHIAATADVVSRRKAAG